MALTDKGLGDAVQLFIEKDEKDAISELINFQIEKIQVKIHLKLSIKSNKKKINFQLLLKN